MNSHELLERAKWHNRRALSFAVDRARDPHYRHHARCFVMLCALLRKANDFDDCNKVMTP